MNRRALFLNMMKSMQRKGFLTVPAIVFVASFTSGIANMGLACTSVHSMSRVDYSSVASEAMQAQTLRPADRYTSLPKGSVTLAQEKRRGPVFYIPLPPEHRHRPQDLEPIWPPGSASTPARPHTASTNGLTLEKLKNAEYRSSRYGKVKLQEGHSSDFRVHLGYELGDRLSDLVAFGNLAGDGADCAAVILASYVGASGCVVELAVMTHQNGVPRQVAAVVLGGSVNVKRLSMRSGQIIVEMLKHGPDDAHCCPSVPVTEKYRLQGGRLALVP